MKHVFLIFTVAAVLFSSVLAETPDDDVVASYLFVLDNDIVYNAVDENTLAISNLGDTLKVDIHGGSIGTVTSVDRSIVGIYEGVFENVSARFSSTLNIFGGQSHVLSAFDSGVINIYGGDIVFLGAHESSTINLFGYNFSYELYDTPISGSVGLAINGKIFGNWSDTTPFMIEIGDWYGDVPLENPITFDHIVFHTIPEPASAVLLGLGGLMVALKRKLRTRSCSVEKLFDN